MDACPGVYRGAEQLNSGAEKGYNGRMDTPDTPQSVELTRSERELLLNIRHIAPEAEKKIVSARITVNRFHIELTTAEIEGLMAGLSSEANYTDDRTMARAYEELREKLEKLEKH
jgi:hypothetical protein